MHHLATRWAGRIKRPAPHVVELLRGQARRHDILPRASHLNKPDRIGLLQRVVDLGSSCGRWANRPLVGRTSRTSVRVSSSAASCRARADRPDDAEVGAVFLVPLHDRLGRAWWPVQSARRVELALGRLPFRRNVSRDARQILNGHVEFDNLPMRGSDDRVRSRLAAAVSRDPSIPRGRRGGEEGDCLLIEAESLPTRAGRERPR